MQKQFEDHINNNFSFLNESKLLIAISGGLDSLVLTHLCSQIKLNFALAHCNFSLRGKESNGDEEFVMMLANDLEVEVFVQHFNTKEYANTNKLSTQMAARELRYNWFYDLANELKFDYILTAHHADDNLETFLINLSRGTGPEGLSGIPQINGKVIRPLLSFSREEIETYANHNNLKWREDSSNSSTKYLRNQLRHDIIPKMKELNPNFLNNLLRTQDHINEVLDIVDDKVNDLSDDAIQVFDDRIEINIEEILKQNNPKAYLYQLLHDYGFTEWNDVYNLLSTQPGKYIVSDNWRLSKDREKLILSERTDNSNEAILIAYSDTELKTPFGVVQFEETEHIIEKGENTIYVDKSKLEFPLAFRKRQTGDKFYPLGMQGSKKLSKYFKDEKLSLLDKENTWLLCSGNDIVWVINRRVDRRFAATENTKQVLRIELL